MSFEPKPGQFSLFKNDRKTKDSHPDYRGDGVNLDGALCWISAWIKKGAKGTFMSLSVQPKEEQRAPASRGGGGGRGFNTPDMDDSIPFATSDSLR